MLPSSEYQNKAKKYMVQTVKAGIYPLLPEELQNSSAW